MTLGKFISHIKHNSVCINLVNNDICDSIWSGDIGSYKHWIHKDKYDDKVINSISFNFNGIMLIYLEGE